MKCNTGIQFKLPWAYDSVKSSWLPSGQKHWRIEWSMLVELYCPFAAHCVKSVQMRNFSGPYFPVIGLNTEIYSVNLLTKCEYRKIRTRKNSVFGHFSCTGRPKVGFGLKAKLIKKMKAINRTINFEVLEN